MLIEKKVICGRRVHPMIRNCNTSREDALPTFPQIRPPVTSLTRRSADASRRSTVSPRYQVERTHSYPSVALPQFEDLVPIHRIAVKPSQPIIKGNQTI